MRDAQAGWNRSAPVWRRGLPVALLLAGLAGCGGAARQASYTDIPVQEAERAVAAGIKAERIGEYRNALAWTATGLARYRSIDDARGMVVASLNLADTLLLIGEHERAARHIAEARSLVETNGLAGFDAHLALLTAYARVQAGDDPGARRALAAMPAADGIDTGVDEAGHRAALAARLLLADIAIRSDTAEAGGLLAVLGPAVAASDDPIVRGRYRRLLAELALREGDTGTADTQLHEALEQYREVHYRPGIAATHERLGALYGGQQRWQESASHLRRALQIRLWIGDRVHSLQVMDQLALAQRRLGHPESAVELTEWRGFLAGADEIPWQMLKRRFGDPGPE